MCFEKVPYMALYNEKIRVWNSSQMMWDSFQNISLMQKKLSFIVSGTLTCICMPVYGYACIKHAYAGLEQACAYAYMHMHALVFLGLNFPKINLFSS